jgi:transcription initiation factor IIE alpha subunit
VALIGTCPRCGESVELVVSKKQLKAIMKGFKAASPSEAEKVVETILRRDGKGDLKR